MNVNSTIKTVPLYTSLFLTRLLLWWWPVFIFLSPLLFTSLGHQYRIEMVISKYVLGLVALTGGALLEWGHRTSAPVSKRISFSQIPLFDFNSMSILAFGSWCLMATIMTPEPIIALTGTIYEKSDAALWTLTLTLCSWLIYLRCKHDSFTIVGILYAATISGGLIALLALVEILIGHGIIYQASREILPVVTFPQKGHLSGFFVMCFGVSIAALKLNRRLFYICTLLCCLGVGLCFNRASLLGIALAVLGCLIVNWQRYWLISILVVCFISLGWATVQTFNVQGKRELTSPDTLTSRSYMWKAGLNGIIKRPWAGWGGGYFQRVWTRYVSFEDVKAYMQLEFGSKIVKVDGELLVTRNPNGTLSASPFLLWKSHNQLIEVALLYGIPGLLLYLLILYRLFRAGGLRNPAVIGVFAYHVFFMLWFSIPESDGVLWALIGAGMAGLPAARALETSILEPSPPLHSSS